MAADKCLKKMRLNERRILIVLEEKPRTVKQLACALNLSKSGTALYLKRMQISPRRIYVCGHATPESHGSPAPIWAAGDRPHVEYVPLARRAPKLSAERRCDRILALLTEKPYTLRQLSQRVHLVPEAVGRYVWILRKAKKAYIARWLHPREVNPENRNGGDWAPAFSAGDRPDAPKPKRETSKERHARLQKSKAYREAKAAAQRARYQQEKMIKQHVKAGPQTWISALERVA